LSQLALAEEEGDTLSEEELISTAILLLVAGHETTVNLIAGGVLSLVQHPVQLERLRSDPSVVRSGVEEMLRYVSPVQLTGRTLLEPMTVGEADLEAGEFVIILIGSANRDRWRSRTPRSSTSAGPQPPSRLRFRDPPLPGCAAGPSRGPGGHFPSCSGASRRSSSSRTDRPIGATSWLARARDAARAPDRGLKKGLRGGAPGAHEWPGPLVLDGESEVEQQGLRVVAADDLHPDREAVDAATGSRSPGCLWCWPDGQRTIVSRWPGQSHTRPQVDAATVVLMGPAREGHVGVGGADDDVDALEQLRHRTMASKSI